MKSLDQITIGVCVCLEISLDIWNFIPTYSSSSSLYIYLALLMTIFLISLLFILKYDSISCLVHSHKTFNMFDYLRVIKPRIFDQILGETCGIWYLCHACHHVWKFAIYSCWFVVPKSNAWHDEYSLFFRLPITTDTAPHWRRLVLIDFGILYLISFGIYWRFGVFFNILQMFVGSSYNFY